MNWTHIPAAWGFLGAFMYAAPKLLVCWRAADWHLNCYRCAFESLVALSTGAIAAAAFSPAVSHYLNRMAEHDARAIATILGLLANPLAPLFVKAMGIRLMRQVGGTANE